MSIFSARPATLAGLAAAAATLTLVPPGAQAAAPSYVALGDSYASGTGTRSYIDDGTDCLRSVYAYPALISSARGYELNFRACSGATIPDVANNQVGALTSSTSYVTVSVGGNDAGFASVLTTCALPAWMSNCNGAINKAQSYITNTLPGALSTLYADIRARAPRAKVVVVGYPRIFNGTDCNALTWFSGTEMSRLNYTADLLNSRLASAASAKGFTFANPTSRFLGRAVCDSPEWINGLSNPIVESYHPKTTGHAYGYTPTVSPVLTGATVTVGRALMRESAASADELAATQEQYAAADAAIEPAEFRAPDLDSRKARRAARRAGVDLSDPASIDRVDRRYARKQARAFAAG